ncbi:MAG TPA: hypothetical protein VL947_01805 [Cytophagales bacterium]|nr:hypothetical protein [Cytophagales bacterium]
MKTLLGIILVLTLSCNAQFTSITPKVGLNYGSHHGYYYGIGFKERLSYALGLATAYKLRETESLKIELMYYGLRMIDPITWYDAQGNISNRTKDIVRFDYLTLPLSLQKSFGAKKNGFTSFGLVGGYLVNYDLVTRNGTERLVRELEMKQKVYWGALLSFGSKINLKGRNKLSVEFKTQYLRNDGHRTLTFFLLLGYDISLSKADTTID